MFTRLASLLPGVRAAQADDDRRAAVLSEMAADTEGTERRVMDLSAELSTRRHRVDLARVALAAAYAAAGELETEISQVRQAFNLRRDERERFLLATADPRIDAFIESLDKRRSMLRVTVGVGPVVINPQTGSRRRHDVSNLGEIRVIATALLAARERATALKLQGCADLDRALEEIWNAIPTDDQAFDLARAADQE